MEYKYLKDRGALAEGKAAAPEAAMTIAGFTPRLSRSTQLTREQVDRLLRDVPPEIATRIPESIAREETICPIFEGGETLTIATTKPDDVMLQDKLRFVLGKEIVFAPRMKPRFARRSIATSARAKPNRSIR